MSGNKGLMLESRELVRDTLGPTGAVEWADNHKVMRKLEMGMNGLITRLDPRLSIHPEYWELQLDAAILSAIITQGPRNISITPLEGGLQEVKFTDLGGRIILAPKYISMTNNLAQFSIGEHQFDGVAIYPIKF